MIFLAITQNGLNEVLDLIGSTSQIWCGSDAISKAEFEALRSGTLTRFDYSLKGAKAEVMRGAIETIVEHHPGERIWVEVEADGAQPVVGSVSNASFVEKS